LFCCSKNFQKDLKTCSSANKIAQNAYSKFQKIWEVKSARKIAAKLNHLDLRSSGAASLKIAEKFLKDLRTSLLKIWTPWRFERFKCKEDCWKIEPLEICDVQVQVRLLNLNSQEICKVQFVEHTVTTVASNNAQGNMLILCKLRNITSNFFQIVGKKIVSATLSIFFKNNLL